MNITQGTLFHYAFFISITDNEDHKKIKEIQDWCDTDLNGQWIIIDKAAPFTNGTINITYFSKAIHSLPAIGEEYPPARKNFEQAKIIAFEQEDDAAAFKLMWM